MTQKALAIGSTYPELEKGKLRIYSNRFCPFSERTRLVLAHKNLDHEIVNIHALQPPEWYFEVSPLGATPTLEHHDNFVYDSGICCDYLDGVCDVNKLNPTDSHQRAHHKMLMESFVKVTCQMPVLFEKLTAEERKVIYEDIFTCFDVFENSLDKTYFGGSGISMVDLYIWPWFERIPMIITLFSDDLLPEQRFPKLTTWVQNMLETDAVKACALPNDIHIAFMKTHFDGKPDYDIGLA